MEILNDTPIYVIINVIYKNASTEGASENDLTIYRESD